MSDDVLTQARRVWRDLIAAGPYRTDGEKLLPDLIALAETKDQQLTEIRELHYSTCMENYENSPWCDQCGMYYPCPTVAILDRNQP